jgi:hypothetical protein
MRAVSCRHDYLGHYTLAAEGDPEVLVCDNDTNRVAVFGADANDVPYPKDAINRHVVNGEADAVNPQGIGTKAAFWYSFDEVQPGDLITAKFMNALLRKLARLEAVVLGLSDSPDKGKVKVPSLFGVRLSAAVRKELPARRLRVGTVMDITGRKMTKAMQQRMLETSGGRGANMYVLPDEDESLDEITALREEYISLRKGKFPQATMTSDPIVLAHFPVPDAFVAPRTRVDLLISSSRTAIGTRHKAEAAEIVLAKEDQELLDLLEEAATGELKPDEYKGLEDRVNKQIRVWQERQAAGTTSSGGRNIMMEFDSNKATKEEVNKPNE